MTAPADLTLTFDQASYPPGAPVTATLAGTGQNTSGHDRTLSGTLTDETTGEVSDVTGTFTVDLPNTLRGAVSETGTPAEWAPGEVSQAGQQWAGTFTATAA